MAKFHINMKTGEPGKCNATKGGCPFGTDAEHFTSIEAARSNNEKLLQDSNGWAATKKEILSPETIKPTGEIKKLENNTLGIFDWASLNDESINAYSVLVTAHHEYQDSDEYLWQNADRRVTPTAEVVSAAQIWAADLVKTIHYEYLPEVYTDDEVESEEDEGLITTLSQMNNRELAGGQCVQTSEAIEIYIRSGLPADERPYACRIVQGMPEPHEQLNCHYALLVTMKEGDAPVIVDFTYAQVDDTAPFPLVVSASDWEQRMLGDMERLN